MAGEQIGALRITLGLDSVDFSNGMKNANRQLTALNSEFRAISTGSAKFDNSLETLRARADVLTRTMNTHREKVEELRRQYEHSKTTKGEDAAETVRLATAYNRAVSAMNATEQRLRTVNSQIDEQTNSFRQLEREVNTNVDSISRQMRVLESGYDAATAGSARLENSVQGLREREQHLTQTLALQEDRLKELTRLHEAAAREKGEDAQETQELQIRLNRANQTMRETETQLRQTTDQIQQQSGAWNRLSRDAVSSGDRMQQIGGRMQSTGSEITQTFGTAFLAVGAGLGLTAKSAMDFESQMSSVKSVMAPAEVDQFGKSLENLAMKMGAETKYSSLEAAQGIEELIKAGVQVTDIVNGGLDGALSLAVAGELELADAAEVASTALNAFKKDNLSVMDAADLLAGAANASATSVAEMKYSLSMVSAVASGVGLSFKDTNSALAVFAQNGLKGSDAGTSLKTMLLNLSPSTDAASKQMDKLGLLTEKGTSAFYDANGSIKSMADIAELLKTKLGGLSDEQRQMALKTMFGTDAIRAANILYNEGADGINNMTDAMTKIKSADVAATKLDNVKGRIQLLKGAVETTAISFGQALLPTIDKVTAKVQDLTNWFNSLSPEMKENLVNAGLLAAGVLGVTAAIGGTLAVAGMAVTGIGALTTAFGVTAAAAGAVLGPVALVALAVGGVTAAVIATKNATEKAKEVNLEHAESLIEQQQNLEDLSDKYENLRGKSRLSNDEILRYRDIQSELKFAKTAEEVKALTNEQNKLLEKSGLSNEEMSTMLQLNDDLIKLVPDVDKALSEHGDAVIGNADAIGEANEKLRENIALELENQRIKAEAQLDQNIMDYISALDELNAKEAERNKLVKERDENEVEIARLRIEAQNKLNEGKEREAQKTIDEIAKAEILLAKQNDKILGIADEVEEKQKSVSESEKEIQKTQTLYEKMINLHLEQIGINETGSKGIAQLDDAIKKTQTRISELNKLKGQQGGLNEAQQLELDNLQTSLGQYHAKKQEIQRIQGEQATVNSKIDQGTGKAKQMTDELNKGTTKNVKVDDKGKVKDLNDEISKAVTKKVTLSAIWKNVTQAMKDALPFFASGTTNAPGGPSVVGEAGRELLHINGGMYLATGPSLVNLPRGAKVIPNRDTESILRKWNVPMLATGGVTLTDGMAYIAERGRELIDLSGAHTAPLATSGAYGESMTKQPLIIQMVTPDKRVLAEMVVDDITGLQSQNKRLNNRFRGR